MASQETETPSIRDSRATDACCVVLLLALLVGIGVWSPVLPPTLQQDNLQYLAMARNLSAFFEVPGIYAQRIVPCAIVWGLNRAGLCDVVSGFCAVSYTAVGSFLIGLYLTFRRAGLSPAIATAAAVFGITGSWPVVYNLSNVYQACDALAYPLGLGFFCAAISNRPGWAFMAGALGLGCRQQLFILVILGDLAKCWGTRRWQWRSAFALHLVIFGLLVATAGQKGVAQLMGHTLAFATAWSSAARGLYESRLPLLLSPYLLVLLVHGRTTREYLVRYWWVAGFALITALQPMFAFRITGPENAARLAMIGLWPALLLGGVLVGRNVQSTGWAPVFLLSPLIYGTEHLVSFTAGWPCLLGHRAIANVALAVISVLPFLRRSRIEPERPAPGSM